MPHALIACVFAAPPPRSTHRRGSSDSRAPFRQCRRLSTTSRCSFILSTSFSPPSHLIGALC
eukprot:4298554-Pleurochrysis_carterae.AAC.1